MPYLVGELGRQRLLTSLTLSLSVRERWNDSMCVVEGLGGEELRQITSRQEQMDPEEKYRRVEFNTPAYNMLNALEKLGYR